MLLVTFFSFLIQYDLIVTLKTFFFFFDKPLLDDTGLKRTSITQIFPYSFLKKIKEEFIQLTSSKCNAKKL